MAKRKNSKLAIGDKVLVKFLGSPYNAIVTEVTKKDLYKVKTKTGTIFPSCTWEDKSAKDKNDKIISPWYIVRTGHENITE